MANSRINNHRPEAVKYSVVTKYAKCGRYPDPHESTSLMLNSIYGVLAPLPDAKVIDGHHTADKMYWIVGTSDALRSSYCSYNNWTVEKNAVKVIEFSIIPTATLDIATRVNAVKEFLDREAISLPYRSGIELRKAMNHWPKDAIAGLCVKGYGLFCDGGGPMILCMPSNASVKDALAAGSERLELTISGRDSWPLSDDPEDGWEDRYWTATYTIHI